MQPFIQRAALPLFSLALFLSAALLFLIQLIFARMVLPLLGGSAAVWNTAMVFYQAVLLAGYGYAHAVSTRLPLRTQVGLQSLVLVLPALVLPFALPSGWVPPAEGNPIPWLLALLATGAGLPFFAVSSTSPLLQKWFACTSHSRAADPYFLYGASNAGSLLGLLGYPFVIEPHSSLALQAKWWAWGYAALAVLILAAGVAAAKCRGSGGSRPGLAVPKPRRLKAPEARERLRWIVYALVPSSLMLSATAYVSSEIATVPLLWVLPLAIYLGTFILAFARRPVISHALARRLLPIALVPAIMVIATGATSPVVLLIAAHFFALFVVALVCHGELAATRPAEEHLTEFYFWVSLGGVIGGVCNALLAPLLFKGILEYHLGLIAAAYLGVESGAAVRTQRQRRLDVLLPCGLAVLVLALLYGFAGESGGQERDPGRALLVFGVPVLLCFLMARSRMRFGLGVAVILLSSYYLKPGAAVSLYTERSFFGIHRVVHDRKGGFHGIMHGRTLHGVQSTDPAKQNLPLAYYHPSGPLGQIFRAFSQDLTGPVAAVGLGAGAIAAYGRSGVDFTFYEIDPVVKRLASDPRYFTFLSSSAADIRIVLGDARLSLQSAPDAHYQLMVLDAYSSDSIPVHLLTREAVQLYLRKLRPGGLLALHISNQHLRLRPVVAALARDAGLFCLVQNDTGLSMQDQAEGKLASEWAVLARSSADLARLSGSKRWQPDPGSPANRVWTDDYSSVVSVLDWGLGKD